MWKGGRQRDGHGYILIRRGPGVYVREHIDLMEHHLGRALEERETVHHRNGVRSDNRLENLELWSSKHPSGQRVADLVQWAKRILALYDT